jgi:polysaccharide chain length determinant protein (PEP-CTERM system associated)
MAWKHRAVILVSMIAGAYGALIVSSQLEDKYQSEMLIQIVPQRVPDEYVRSSVTMRTEDRLLSLSQQVMSRTELERLIEQMNLYPRERARRPMQDIVQRMRENIVVSPAETGADAFVVQFTYPDRDMATRVTERLGALFINTNAQDRGNLAQATNDFLQTQLEESRTKLEEQERRLEAFRQRNAGRLPSQLDFNLQAISRAQLELQARVESIARDRDRKQILERLYEEAQRDDATVLQTQSGATGPDGQPAGTPEQQLAAARANLDRLKLRLTSAHPDVARAERTIRDLEILVAAEAAKQRASGAPVVLTPAQAARRARLMEMRREIEALDREIRTKEAEAERLRTTAATYEQRIEQVPALETEWIALTRDYETQQAAYKGLLAKSEEAQVATALEKRQIGEQFRILDPAREPVRPTGVERVRVNAIGAAAGLAFGLLIAAFRELRDTTLHSAADVVDVLSLPVLARVPFIVTDDDRRRLRWTRLRTSGLVGVCLMAGGYVFWTMELWKHIT